MALNAEEKRERVAEYIDLLKRSQCVVLAEFSGLAMPGMNLLRSRVREAEGVVRVTKNTLIQIAFKEAGLPIPGEHLAGTTLVAFATKDAVAVAKAVMDTAKEMEALKVKGGLLGSRVLTAGEVRSLAQLPPLPVVRGRLVGVLQASASRMVGVLAGSARQMVGVLKAYAEKGAGNAPAAEAAA